MPIVQSFGALQAMTPPPSTWSPSTGGSIHLYGHTQAYAHIYATQPNVRTCVDFLARNIAQLGIKAYRRVSDTDREQLADHDVTRWLNRPNPSTRRYRLMESVVGDLGIYFNAYWLKVRYTNAADGRAAIGLVRLPPEQMNVAGVLLPTHFTWTVNGRVKDFPLSEIVYFNGYNPLNALMGLSPLETLRRVLAEEAAAGEHREFYWRNAGRMEGVIEQAAAGPSYTTVQKQEFREQWQEFSSGGAKVGMTAVLPKGMTIKPWSFSAKDAEYLSARKLSREECAAAYQIPQPFVGILDHATFSNIKEQHKHLYQDTLGPWLEMVEEEIEAQLLTECDDQTDVYVEFNIADKLKGSFEEQATGLQQLVGRPIMTANEGRARLNLPSHEDPSADELAAQQGGPAVATATPPEPPAATATPPPPPGAIDLAPVIQATRDRQYGRYARYPVLDRPAAFTADLARWNRELANDIETSIPAARRLSRAAVEQHAADANAITLQRFEVDATRARIEALEHRPARAVRRTFDRNPENGLVNSFVDAEESS